MDYLARAFTQLCTDICRREILPSSSSLRIYVVGYLRLSLFSLLLLRCVFEETRVSWRRKTQRKTISSVHSCAIHIYISHDFFSVSKVGKNCKNIYTIFNFYTEDAHEARVEAKADIWVSQKCDTSCGHQFAYNRDARYPIRFGEHLAR